MRFSNQGWIIPPPKEPSKSIEEFRKEREEKVRWLIRHGYLRSRRIKQAMLKVAREDFIPPLYRDYAYLEGLGFVDFGDETKAKKAKKPNCGL